MAVSIEQFIRELKAFDGRKAVLKELRTAIRKPFPAVRKAVATRALETMPKAGGLNEWVAAIKVRLPSVKTSGRSVGVVVRGGRSSKNKNTSDMDAIDRGRVRHPAWGRRTAGQWANESVPSGFFTEPVTESDEWRKSVTEAVDTAFDQIRRG